MLLAFSLRLINIRFQPDVPPKTTGVTLPPPLQPRTQTEKSILSPVF